MNQDTLPKTWELRPLEEVCTIIMGTSPPSSTYNSDGNGLPFFQGKADFTDLHPVARKWCTSPERIAEPQDILLSVRAPVGAVNVADEKSCIGRGLAALRYSNHKFLFYYLLGIKEELDRKGTGTTFKAISAGTVKEINFRSHLRGSRSGSLPRSRNSFQNWTPESKASKKPRPN
ncbi:MAG: restriction endonuclease subunit S [Acidobacteria bacterium]|nr:restriction endonuclease subunit S [Acidobacteriota bacterium]